MLQVSMSVVMPLPYFARIVALMAFSRSSGRRSLSSSASLELTAPSWSQSPSAEVLAGGAGGVTATGEVPGLSATTGDLEGAVNFLPNFLERTRMRKRVGT